MWGCLLGWGLGALIGGCFSGWFPGRLRKAWPVVEKRTAGNQSPRLAPLLSKLFQRMCSSHVLLEATPKEGRQGGSFQPKDPKGNVLYMHCFVIFPYGVSPQKKPISLTTVLKGGMSFATDSCTHLFRHP